MFYFFADRAKEVNCKKLMYGVLESWNQENRYQIAKTVLGNEGFHAVRKIGDGEKGRKEKMDEGWPFIWREELKQRGLLLHVEKNTFMKTPLYFAIKRSCEATQGRSKRGDELYFRCRGTPTTFWAARYIFPIETPRYSAKVWVLLVLMQQMGRRGVVTIRSIRNKTNLRTVLRIILHVTSIVPYFPIYVPDNRLHHACPASPGVVASALWRDNRELNKLPD